MKHSTHDEILHQSLAAQAIAQRRQLKEIYDLLKAGKCSKAQATVAKSLLVKRVNLRNTPLTENADFHK